MKHFAVNNQELRRHEVDVVVDDRALHEISASGLQAAVQKAVPGPSWAPTINTRASIAATTNTCWNDILKRDWALPTAWLSPTGAACTIRARPSSRTRHGVRHLNSRPDGLNWGATAITVVHLANPTSNCSAGAGGYRETRRQGPPRAPDLPHGDEQPQTLRVALLAGHAATSHRGRGMVLLKNDGGVLPVDLSKTKKLLVVGERREDDDRRRRFLVAQGEHDVPPGGVRAAVGDKAEVLYERGYVGDVTGDYNGL